MYLYAKTRLIVKTIRWFGFGHFFYHGRHSGDDLTAGVLNLIWWHRKAVESRVSQLERIRKLDASLSLCPVVGTSRVRVEHPGRLTDCVLLSGFFLESLRACSSHLLRIFIVGRPGLVERVRHEQQLRVAEIHTHRK